MSTPARTTTHRAISIALAATLTVTPACAPSLSTAGMRLTATTDDVGAVGTGVFAALRERRDAVAPPFALTAIDPPERDDAAPEEDALRIAAVTADVVVEGPLAYTQLALTFVNSEARTREGRFSITLPGDAAIGRFAMRTEKGWREAEVVSRARAREVYETYLHRGVDPALLEQASANTFSARVFPILPKATTELIVGYSQEATASRPPTLALHGLPRVRALTIRIHRGGAVETRSERDVRPEDVRIELAAAAGAVASTTDFVARVPVPAAPGTDPLGSMYLLVDTSASRAGLVGAQISAVRALARGMPADAELTVAAFDQRVDEVYRGRAGDVDGRVGDAILGRGALGASDLGAALTAAARSGHDRAVLIGDAVVTGGETRVPALAERVRAGGFQRVDVVQLGASVDVTTAAAIVGAGVHPGTVIRTPAAGDGGDLIAQLTAPTATPEPIEVDGAAWIWPSSTMGVAGDEIVVYGRRPAGAVGRPLRITVGARMLEVTPDAAPDALVTRAVARAELAVLATRAAQSAEPEQRAALDDQIRAIGLRHRLVSSQTSLLVLESDEDYASFCLSQDTLADLIVVDGTRGLQSRARKPPAQGPSDSCTRDESAAEDGEPEPGFETAAASLKTRAAEATAQRAAEEAARRAASGGRTPQRRSPDGHDRIDPADLTGSIGGVITGRETGERLAGATVVVSWGDRNETAITDENGAYLITGVPPGEVRVTIYYLSVEVSRTIDVRARMRTEVSIAIESSSRGELILIRAEAPTIDPTSASQGITLGDDYTVNIPTGRTFGSVLGAAAGSAGHDAIDLAADPGGQPTAPIAGLPALPAVAHDRQRARRVDVQLSGGDAAARAATIPGRERSHRPHTGVLAAVVADLDRGDPARAVTRAARAQIETPADLGALLALGAAADAQGARALAIRAYGSMIDLYPGQAEVVRAAAIRLERLGDDGLELALDAHARAAADRPDHLHGMRLWAWARARAGDLDGALAVIERALTTPARHAAQVSPALAADLAVLSALIAAADGGRRPALEARLTELGVPWAGTSSTRAFLTWETDANDVDLHVIDAAGRHASYSSRAIPGGGQLLDDLTRGYGPEVFVVGANDPGPMRVAAHYYSRGPMGVGLGALHVIHHDAAAGTVRLEIRPFALQHDDAVVALGTLPGT